MFVEQAMAFVQLRPITVEYDYDASKRAREVVVTAAYGVSEVIAIVQEAYATGDFETAKDLLESENERGCPLS